MGLRNRLNKYSVNKEAVEKALSDTNGRKEDPRFLRLSKLDADKKESIRGLLMIDPNGEIIHRFEKVGPRAKVDVTKNGKTSKQNIRGVEHIGCAPGGLIETQKIDWYVEAKEHDTDAERKEAKLLPNCINTQTNYLVNFLPLECPFTIPETEDGNLVKLIYLPSDVFVEIQKQLENGEMTPEDLAEYPINIKRTKGESGFATYEQSSVSRKPLSDEEAAQFEDDDVIEPYALSELDVVPKIPTPEEEQAWLDKNIPIIRKALGHEGFEHVGEDDGGASDKAEAKQESKLNKTSLQDRLAKKPENDGESQQTPEPEEEQEKEEKVESASSEESEKPEKTGFSLKDRLRNVNKG